MKFLVISYDDDQQQWFYDWAVADSGEAAKEQVLNTRDYVIDADAIDVHELNRLANELTELSDDAIKDHSPADDRAKFTREHRYEAWMAGYGCTILNNGFEPSVPLWRYLAVEKYQGTYAWAFNEDSIEACEKALDDSDTERDYAEVIDLDTGDTHTVFFKAKVLPTKSASDANHRSPFVRLRKL